MSIAGNRRSGEDNLCSHRLSFLDPARNRHTGTMLYFAYGSNMAADQMRERCSRVRFVALGCVSQHAFIINSRSCANIVPHEREKVHGVFWELDAADLRKLDIYEGTDLGCYERRTFWFAARDGSRIPAQIYVSSDRSTGVPGRSYLATILKGGRLHGLSRPYLRSIAQAWSVRRVAAAAHV